MARNISQQLDYNYMPNKIRYNKNQINKYNSYQQVVALISKFV